MRLTNCVKVRCERVVKVPLLFLKASRVIVHQLYNYYGLHRYLIIINYHNYYVQLEFIA
jgi:hypothetical protein